MVICTKISHFDLCGSFSVKRKIYHNMSSELGFNYEIDTFICIFITKIIELNTYKMSNCPQYQLNTGTTKSVKIKRS